jgi:putative sterol carrier protein
MFIAKNLFYTPQRAGSPPRNPSSIIREEPMSYFKDTRHMYDFLEDLWKYIVFESGIGATMKDNGVTYKYIISEPSGFLFVDPENVITGKEADRDAVITMELSGDTIVNFWTKKLSLPVALATRKIKSKGPIPKVLKMLPALKPVHEIFPEYCRKHGISLE